MQKICSTCKKAYSGYSVACPHCGDFPFFRHLFSFLGDNTRTFLNIFGNVLGPKSDAAKQEVHDAKTEKTDGYRVVEQTSGTKLAFLRFDGIALEAKALCAEIDILTDMEILCMLHSLACFRICELSDLDLMSYNEINAKDSWEHYLLIEDVILKNSQEKRSRIVQLLEINNHLVETWNAKQNAKRIFYLTQLGLKIFKLSFGSNVNTKAKANVQKAWSRISHVIGANAKYMEGSVNFGAPTTPFEVYTHKIMYDISNGSDEVRLIYKFLIQIPYSKPPPKPKTRDRGVIIPNIGYIGKWVEITIRNLVYQPDLREVEEHISILKSNDLGKYSHSLIAYVELLKDELISNFSDHLVNGVGEFGTEATNPIPVNGICEIENYIKRLKCSDGSHIDLLPVKDFQTSRVQNLNFPVYEYNIVNNGQYSPLYFYVYCLRTSEAAPKNFTLEN